MLENMPDWLLLALQIITVFFYVIIISGFIFAITMAIIKEFMDCVARKRYLDTLDEHDKSVVITYRNVRSNFLEKKCK